MPLAAGFCVLLLASATFWAHGADEVSTSRDQRRAVPSAAEIMKAEAAINEVFKEELKQARRPRATAEKRALADKFYRQAHESKDDDNTRYVLLRDARRFFEDIGDVTAALKCVDAIGASFVGDSVALKVNSLEAVVPRSAEDSNTLIELSLSLAKQSQEQADFETAVQLFQIAQSHVTKLKDRDLNKRLVDLKQENQERRSQYTAFRAAEATLAKAPDDPAANLAVGKYLCLVLGDWEAGRPKLLKAGGAFMDVAKKESAAPTSESTILELADAWWELAESEKGLARTQLRREAGYWYRTALPTLSGIKKTGVENKLAEVTGDSSRKKLQPGLLMVVYQGTKLEKQIHAKIEPVVQTNFGTGGAAPGLPVDDFSIRWSGVLRVPKSTKYTFVFDHDDGGRLWIGQKLLIDNWNPGVAHDAVEVDLEQGDHPIRIEYFEGGAFGGINLWWQTTTFKREIIPATTLFHDASLALRFGVK